MKLPCKGERKTRVLSQHEKTTIMETSLILPKFNQPTNLDKAAFLINQLGKNIHEHAYLVGKILKWVKEEGVNHGEFISWVEKNVWFDRTTATRYMKFTEQCDKKGILIEYSPRFQMLHRATNENLETPIPPKGEFDLIVIDPAWPYGTGYDSETRRVASPYPEMSIEELKNFKIPAYKDSSLWLWTTHRFIWEAEKLLEHWGFEYKGILTWNKEKLGMGEWLRMQCEFCLLGIKGKPKWNLTNERDIISESRREHSRKPKAFYTMIEKLSLAKRKIDIFGREKRPGWEIYGNETEKF